ncbi:MAG: hypothetical protein HQL10_11910 [Nitrospirae bacterium]|nr:hypothetical protein [Nitrospirota bacterium]
MKGLLTTTLIFLSYTALIVVVINFFAGVFSRRTQRKLRLAAGEKVVDLFKAGDEIKRKRAMAAMATAKAQEQIACVNGPAIAPIKEHEPEVSAQQPLTVKAAQSDSIAHVDRMV